jgi:hypothetical protein
VDYNRLEEAMSGRDDIDEVINEAREAREVKRAVSVKMSAQGLSPAQICQVLNVSL